MSTIIKEVIKCSVGGGADLSDSIREGIVLACKENLIVEFEFNGTTVRIDPKQIVEPLYKHYWDSRNAK